MSFADYLEKMLIKRGFWSDGDDCWEEINENGESFEDVISEVGKEYIPEDGKDLILRLNVTMCSILLDVIFMRWLLRLPL